MGGVSEWTWLCRQHKEACVHKRTAHQTETRGEGEGLCRQLSLHSCEVKKVQMQQSVDSLPYASLMASNDPNRCVYDRHILHCSTLCCWMLLHAKCHYMLYEHVNKQRQADEKTRLPNKDTNEHTDNDHIFSCFEKHVEGCTVHGTAVPCNAV